jgi:hypothetical protein
MSFPPQIATWNQLNMSQTKKNENFYNNNNKSALNAFKSGTFEDSQLFATKNYLK